MIRAACLLVICGCSSLPHVSASSAASEDAGVAPLPRVAVALSEDAPPLDDGGAMDMSMPMHHHGGDHAP